MSVIWQVQDSYHNFCEKMDPSPCLEKVIDNVGECITDSFLHSNQLKWKLFSSQPKNGTKICINTNIIIKEKPG